jgi:hypothetical protein
MSVFCSGVNQLTECHVQGVSRHSDRGVVADHSGKSGIGRVSFLEQRSLVFDLRMALLVILPNYELYVLGLYKNEPGQLTVGFKKCYTGIQLGLTHRLTPVLAEQRTLSASAEP